MHFLLPAGRYGQKSFTYAVSTGTLQLLLCLAVSNIRTEAAIAAFRDSTFPSMGIFTRQSASEVVSSVRPLASFPIKKPTLSV